MSELIEQHRLPSGYEFIVLRGELAEEVIYDVGYSGGSPEWDAFTEAFEIDHTDYLGQAGDSFYQGIYFSRRIVRRADGAEFVGGFWSSPGNDSMESSVTDLLDTFASAGFKVSWDWENDEEMPVIFTPVRRLTRPVLEQVLPS
jgi:hypothetical protein